MGYISLLTYLLTLQGRHNGGWSNGAKSIYNIDQVYKTTLLGAADYKSESCCVGILLTSAVLWKLSLNRLYRGVSK